MMEPLRLPAKSLADSVGLEKFKLGSDLPGTWGVMTPASASGHGAATSCSASLEGRSLALCLQVAHQAHVGAGSAFRVSYSARPGNGERQSCAVSGRRPHSGFGAEPHYLRHSRLHHGRSPFGAGRAWAWACWSKTWSSWTSRRRDSSSSAWAWTWARRIATSSSTAALLSSWWWPFSWPALRVLPASSTLHRNPWGVGSWRPGISPLRMRRLTVSADMPRRSAASWIDTVTTFLPPFYVGVSIGRCLSDRLSAAYSDSRQSLSCCAGQGVDSW